MKSYLKGFVFAFLIMVFLPPLLLRAAEPQAKGKAKKASAKEQAAVKQAAANKLLVAPDFTLQDIYQDEISLSSYRDKNDVLLFFWTTWCPFCQKELSVLNNMYPVLAKDGVEVLAVNIGELADKVRSFVNTYHLAFRVLLDSDTATSSKYDLVGVPTYVLVDKKGAILFDDNFFPSGYKDLIEPQEK